MAPRWEYHVEVLGSIWAPPDPDEVQQFLADSAEQGWELVEMASFQTRNKMMFILRRSVEQRGRATRERKWP